ncbi:Hypothetical protein NTJ_16207 [Nesidiocoris tenuis]|uniref:Uncharacterized protein n=1 Tax=Nesidiocoris tenuis TaxID=355587 RepID=A0ABN7BGI2_9HEMI|nr:Hypothetical protein NTJ_16207 [Nesidiocoris tenuis]
MKQIVVIFLAFASVLGDPSTLVDDILSETRKAIGDSLPFAPLNYYHRNYRNDGDDIDAELKGMGAHLGLGSFVRKQAPVVWGSQDQAILESRFFIDSNVTYDYFTASNFTSGEHSQGNMNVYYDYTEIFSWISIDRKGGNCLTSVSTFMPIAMADAAPEFFAASSVDLPMRLFDSAKYTVGFYLNQTIVDVGIKPFSDVVKSRADLCTLLPK